MKSVINFIARAVCLAALVLLCVVAASNLGGIETGPLRRLVHFPLYGSVLAITMSWMLRRWSKAWLACIAGCLAMGYAGQVAWLWKSPLQKRPLSSGLPSLSLMSFNVYRDNDRYDSVLNAIKEAHPDVIFLTEMTPAWHRALEPLSDEYPYRVESSADVLLSRIALEDARKVPVTFDAAQAADKAAGGGAIGIDERIRPHWWSPEILTAAVMADGGRCRVACVHAPTPGSDLSIIIQRACGLVCARELQADTSALAKALLGDLNTSCFSPTFRFIVRQTALRDSARGFGYSPTWGPRLPREPWLPWIGIPIDHILVSDNVVVLEREIGPAIGSDHRWVLARLAWEAR